MARALAEIERDIQALSAADRARLLKSLIGKIDAPADADVDSAWLAESERRLDQIENGQARTYSGAEVLKEARSLVK